MELAIVKAKEAGIGWVTCTGEHLHGVCSVYTFLFRCLGSNHYGIAGQYAMQALDHGLLVGPSEGVCINDAHVIYSTGNVLHEFISSRGPHQSETGICSGLSPW